MPWTPLLGPIVQGLRRTSWKHPKVRLAICWIVFPFLFFSACGGKLATYVLPCFPPLAFLIAVGVHNYLQAGKARGFIVGTWIVVCLTALLLAALVVGLIVRPQLKDSVGLWPWTLTAAGVIAWGVLGRMAITASNVRNRLLLFSAAPMLLMLGVPFVAPAFAKTSKRPGEFLLAQAAKIPPQGVIVTPSGLAATACWYYQRSDVFILGGKGEYAYGLGYEDSKHRVLDLEDFQRLLAQESGRTNVTLILNTKDYGRQAKLLPEPVFKVESQDLVFAQFAVTAGGTNRPTTVAPATDP
jgi:4-amino-4-deoxy-L-arabinose transferase